jgi:hypothetical protein
MTLKEADDPDISWINPPSLFFVIFVEDDEEDSFFGEVMAQTKDDDIEKIGEVDWKDGNKQNFQVTLCTDD